MVRRAAVAWALMLFTATAVSAQSGSSGTSPAQGAPGSQPSSASAPETSETRPATTTFFGDTGLWFVPTAEVLPGGRWSASGYRRGTNFTNGFVNVGDFAGTFAVGLGDRAEIFGSFLFVTRIDRDLRPVFTTDPDVGGLIAEYPRTTRYWSGNQVGDLYVGAKVNLLSEWRQNPMALAVRGIVKAPTGDDEFGASTGKANISGDLVLSKELMRYLDLAGFAGYEYRGEPDGFESTSGAFRWGVGAGFASRSPIKGVLELNGFVPNDDTLRVTGSPIVAIDGSVAPTLSNIQTITRATAALTYQHRNGFFVGGGVSWNVPTEDRDNFRTDGDAFGDFVDWQVRLGFHPGTRVFVPPPPPPAPAPPAPPPANRPPTVKAVCDPCSVQVGQSSTVRAQANDPDGDQLTYRWTSPQGTLATAGAQQSQWTAPQQEGTVPVTVTVNDGRGGTATDTVNIQVTRPPVKQYTFEDVHFEFDRFNLRPEATRVLDEAVNAMREDATLRLEIEGHTCNIGTAEYNLALGDRRANAVRDYLVSRGVTADRLRTVSYGEERPKHDNAREETRRLNRRAALVVNLQR